MQVNHRAEAEVSEADSSKCSWNALKDYHVFQSTQCETQVKLPQRASLVAQTVPNLPTM